MYFSSHVLISPFIIDAEHQTALLSTCGSYAQTDLEMAPAAKTAWEGLSHCPESAEVCRMGSAAATRNMAATTERHGSLTPSFTGHRDR